MPFDVVIEEAGLDAIYITNAVGEEQPRHFCAKKHLLYLSDALIIKFLLSSTISTMVCEFMYVY